MARAGSRCSPFHHSQKKRRWLSLRRPQSLRRVGQRPGLLHSRLLPQVRRYCLACALPLLSQQQSTVKKQRLALQYPQLVWQSAASALLHFVSPSVSYFRPCQLQSPAALR